LTPAKPTLKHLDSADGVSGVLCRSAVDGHYFFRVYDASHNFVDYALVHEDLAITIATDALASFYQSGNDFFLDHSPEVLGRVDLQTTVA
jgi:hypothetical protein